MALPYPHERNDCDYCQERDADLVVTYPDQLGRPARWCATHARLPLALMVRQGYIVTVRASDDANR